MIITKKCPKCRKHRNRFQFVQGLCNYCFFDVPEPTVNNKVPGPKHEESIGNWLRRIEKRR